MARVNAVLGAGVGDETLGEDRTLARRDHPADQATEDVEDHVEIEVGPRGRPTQFGDIPAPHGVRAGGQELGRGVVRATDTDCAAL